MIESRFETCYTSVRDEPKRGFQTDDPVLTAWNSYGPALISAQTEVDFASCDEYGGTGTRSTGGVSFCVHIINRS